MRTGSTRVIESKGELRSLSLPPHSTSQSPRKAGNDNVNSLGTLKGGIFDRPLSVGEFAHICTFHSNMEGTLSVQ